MNENVLEIIRDMLAGGLRGREQEEKEFVLVQELCGASDPGDISKLLDALGASGTILSVPAICATLKTEDEDNQMLAEIAIDLIRARAQTRGSILPKEYYTVKHWKPKWIGNTNSFLSYVQVIADIYIKAGHEESEENRIGEILAQEMGIDLSPFTTFADFKICQTDWDFESDYRIVMDRMAQEEVMIQMDEAGIVESVNSFLADSLRNLQHDYLVARLKLKGNLEYYRFVLKMAESLNTTR
ncbi:MAG: hypothetical protein ABIN91_02605 [Mucilaginibacter sp.]|uniref:hypothetical protein n=1 Tax=Mucilaginibacter sp. TaxID=1882438 RepID=UPI003263B125